MTCHYAFRGISESKCCGFNFQLLITGKVWTFFHFTIASPASDFVVFPFPNSNSSSKDASVLSAAAHRWMFLYFRYEEKYECGSKPIVFFLHI